MNINPNVIWKLTSQKPCGMARRQDFSNKMHNCVNSKMIEHDWLICGLIGCFRSKLSRLTYPITYSCNQTGQIGQLSSQ